jgi:uncharacterized protein (TIGR04255 family)
MSGAGVIDEENVQNYVIDMDFFTEVRSTKYDVFTALNRFHDLAWNFFRWAIKDVVHEALQPQHHD